MSGELGLRKFLEGLGHTFVVTSDKDGANSVFERELRDADIVISQPFWPAYLTAERIAKAPKLKFAITAGIGSDHVDLQAAIENGITVAEVTFSNSISVAEHVVMAILSLVRNYIPSYKWVVDRWLEHRRLRRTLLRPGGDGRRNRRRPDASGRLFSNGCGPSTSSSTTPTGTACRGGRRRAGPRRTTRRPVARQGLRRRDHQRAAPPRDRGPVRRRADLDDEARGVSREHSSREDLRDRRRHRAEHSNPDSSPDTQGTSGSPSRHRATTRGGRCLTTG